MVTRTVAARAKYLSMVEGVLKNRLGLTDKPIRQTVRIQSPTDEKTYLGYDSKFGFCSANQSQQVEVLWKFVFCQFNGTEEKGVLFDDLHNHYWHYDEVQNQVVIKTDTHLDCSFANNDSSHFIIRNDGSVYSVHPLLHPSKYVEFNPRSKTPYLQVINSVTNYTSFLFQTVEET